MKKLPWHQKYCDFMDLQFGVDGWNLFSPSVKFDWWLQFIELSHPMFKKKAASPKGGKGGRVWEVYIFGFNYLYKTDPVRNAMTNKICCNLIERLGEEEAIAVVKFFLNQRDAFYLKNTHHLRFCLQDCETLHTKMKSGFKITNKQAKNLETSSHNANVTRDYLQEKHDGKAKD